MNTKSKVSEAILYVCSLAFVPFVLYILYINKEVLYTASERSEFFVGAPFFNILLSKPFGLMQYVGAWLTQYLCEPAIGACLLCAIWVLIFFVGKAAFRLKGNATALMLLPISFLLTSVVDLGYWIYVFTIRGYWFSQSVAYLVMLLLLWGARYTPRKWQLIWYIVGICLYPVLGWFALLFVVCLALTDKITWRELLGIVLLLFTANIWRALLYADVKLDDVMMAGLPHLINPSNESEYLSIPFWMLGAVSLLIAPLGRYCAKWFVPVLSVVVGMVFTCSFMFQDKNYIDEMRMVRSAEADNWKEVLDIYEESSKPTISMVALKNVALMNEGGLLDRSFQINGNDPQNLYNPDSLQVSFLEIASPVAYYNYGMFNEGFRLAFECGEQSGFSPFYLKMLCRCAFANGEEALVKRYTSLLHDHPYYSDWQPAPVSDVIKELHASYQDELSGIENSYSYIISSISLWYDADNKVSSEQALFYSMIRCDSQRFWKSLRKYVKMHVNEEFPLHAQEAYILFMDKSPEEKRIMMPVRQEVYDRYKDFWNSLESLIRSGIDQKSIPEKMRAEFGDTYWYFNIFGRKFLNSRVTATSY